ncbi:MAG: iron complex outerrane recepter protein [Alphaproteobacteria bacterium]|jgi:iron complex outermembrane receptor protein|nr:iron complex outerrane recepter protein [Alphaproteobacteria bacterium]
MLRMGMRGRNRGRGNRCGLLSCSALTLLPFALLAASPGAAQENGQDPNQLPRVDVSTPTRPQTRTRTPAQPARSVVRRPAPTPVPAPAPTPVATTTTPLNTNAVATSASRLGLTVLETPATVEVVDQQTMQEQGYRTTAETANGATGVLSLDAAGAPANFSMRGFSNSAVNVLYNGISIGPAGITSRWMDTANLEQVEFLKGPSALMSGLNAIGGSVNYVNMQPTSGPIRNELDLSWDSLGSVRSHFGSGGNAGMKGLDYRFDLIESRVNGFIDDVDRKLAGVSTQVNYRVSDQFKTFAAVEFKKDSGHAYWGTPLVPTAFAGANGISGVVSGTAISTFDGSIIGPVTIDRRTLKTNYNVLDNDTGAHELWLRSGYEWALTNDLKVKSQFYSYQAKRHWLDSETYAFNTTTGNTIDRDRFFVGHDQHVVGTNSDLVWDSRFLGLENRFAAQLQVSSNRLTFSQHAGGFPEDSVPVINPSRGVYGVLEPDTINKQLDIVATSFEDRLKVTPWLALIGGLRFEHMTLESNRINFDGSLPPANFFTKSWNPVSYRAAVTVEPIRNLVFYAMTSTAFDPAAAGIFSIRPGTSVELTSAKIYEAGVKQLFWDNKAEWTLSVYDITRRNVYVQITNTIASLAGEIDTKGVEFAAAVRPIDGLKLWGNVAFTEARYKNFDVFTGNTPSNIAPIIVNAGASYRWDHYWRWPVEIGASVRHVGDRFLFEDDLTTMNAYTTADIYAFVYIPGVDFGRPEIKDVRVAFRVRNVTDAIYAAFSDNGYPDQIYLGAPRTYEVSASFKF